MADRIEQRMSTLGISQAELARQTGLKPPSIHNWLSGKTKTLKADTLLRLAGILQCRPLWLSKGVGPMALEAAPPYSVNDDGPPYLGWTKEAREESPDDAEIRRLLDTLNDAAKADVLQWLRGFASGRKSGNHAA